MSDMIEAPESEAMDAEPTTRMNMIQAINSAMDIMMERDPDVIVMGEDVGYFGGVFRATAGLQAKHGKTRVFDTPITECGIIGVAVGMGAYVMRARAVTPASSRGSASSPPPTQAGPRLKAGVTR